MKKKHLLPLLFIPFLLSGCNNSSKDSKQDESSTKIDESSISLTESKISLMEGETHQLEAVVKRTGSLVFWSIRDSEIAEVSDTGVVTAIKEGETMVYAKCGKDVAMCAVRVSKLNASSDLYLLSEKTSFNLNVGDTFELPITAKYGSEVVEPTYTYSVDDEAIISVSNNTVTALGSGTSSLLVSGTYEGLTSELLLTITVY